MSETRGKRPYGIGIFWFVTLLVGCVGFGPGRDVVWRFDDPPGLSPYAQPLNSAPAGTTQQSVTKPDASMAGPNGPDVAGGNSANRRGLNAPDPGQPRTNSAGRPPASPTPAPSIPQRSQNQPVLELEVVAPESVAVDDSVSLQLSVRNRTALPAENVTVTVRFNKAWQFTGSERQSIEEQLGRLAPDAERGLTFSLWAREPGLQTVELVIQSETHDEVARTVSIDVRPPIVDMQIVGPLERTVGSRAEYVLTLTNVSRQAQPDTHVDIGYDESLLLKEVSAGVERTAGNLTWDLGELLQDERVQIQIEFECAAAADDSCLRVRVRGRDFGAEEKAACLQIAVRPEVDLQISDAADPIAVDESTTFTIRVANGGSIPRRGVSLHLTPTEQLEIVSVQARAASADLAIEIVPGSEGWTVTSREELPAAGVFTYEVQVHARAIGVGQVIALLKYDGLPVALNVREMTVVDPPVVRRE
jgi:hypothetical protein